MGGKPRASASSSAAEIDAYFARLDDWRGDRLREIRAVFVGADDGVVEELKYRGSPVWSRAGALAVANAHAGKVKITFSQGAHLADKHGLFNAGLGGNQWRAIDLYEGDSVDAAALTDLVREAIRYNQSR